MVDNCSSPPISLSKTFTFSLILMICKKTGSYAARNTAISHAKGKYVAFLDADCLPSETWLENGIEAISNTPDSIIGGNIEILFPKTAVGKYQYMVGFFQKQNIELKNFSATANLFVESSVLEQVGLFNDALLSGGDREWCWRAHEIGFKTVYCDSAKVFTSPRETLPSAIRQTRRVAGGRYQLQKLNSRDKYHKTEELKPHRNGLKSVLWILQYEKYPFFERVKFSAIAILLRFVQGLKSILSLV